MEDTIIIKNPDTALAKEIQEAIAANDGYCVCAIERTPETKCMCKFFRELPEGPCHCGLYIKVKEKDGTTKE